MKKLLAALLQVSALACAPAAALAQAAVQPGLADARGKFSVAGLACDQQNSGQPWAAQVGRGPDGSQLVRHEIRYRWETVAAFDAGTGKNRSEDACNVLYSPGQTVHAHMFFKVEFAKPLASPWGVVTPFQLHQAEQPGDRGNSPVYASYLMPEKDGSTSFTINVNTTPDPTKEVSYHELARLKNFAVGVPHELEVFLVANAFGPGSLVALVDGKLVVNYSGPVGIGSRQFYPKEGWYDGGDDQVRAVSVWGVTISATP